MIVIAGAGLAGMSTALYLKRPYTIVEKESEPGGLVRTICQDGFSYDYAGHWFHARLDWVKQLLSSSLGKNWAWHRRDARIWSKGVFTAYPFQINLGGLPADVIVECIMGMIQAQYTKWNGPVKDFEQFILRSMGTGVAKHFMVPYNTKLWHLAPRDMTTDWMGRFVPQPQIEGALRNALDPTAAAEAGYNAGFHYPMRGGSAAISNVLAGRIERPMYSVEVVAVEARKRRVHLSNGEVVDYDAFVSTMPLRELALMTKDAPANVRRAAAALRWVVTHVLHLGVTDMRMPLHWLYVPEADPRFFRVGCYSNACPSMAPRGMSSLYVEYSLLPGAAKPTSTMTGQYAMGWLKKMGVLGRGAKLVHQMHLPIKYGYVQYDHHRGAAVKVLQQYFQKHNIHSIGRYGAWEYSAMEDAMEQGRLTAQRLNQQ